MARMRHPCVVNFLGVCTMPAAIITEFAGNGSLYTVLTKARKRPALAAQLTWRLRLQMVRQPALRAP